MSAQFVNQASDICKVQYYRYMYVWSSCILLAGTGVRKNSTLARVFSPIEITETNK